MSVNLSAHWANPAVAEACREVKALAPALINLLYDPVMPEKPLGAVLDWAELAAIPGSMSAFELPLLRDVLPALVTAFIASHTYSLRAAGKDRGSVRLILRDTGHGAVVGRIVMLITEVIAPAHGDDGREVARESRSDLAQSLFLIVEQIKAY